MGLLRGLRRLDERAGVAPPGPGLSRRDYLQHLSRMRAAYVPRQVYEELVELHDRVARLEAEVIRLRDGTD